MHIKKYASAAIGFGDYTTKNYSLEYYYPLLLLLAVSVLLFFF